jgi:hypothetical protein
LKAVANYYRAKNVVLFEWRRGKKTQFYVLNKKKEWNEITAQNCLENRALKSVNSDVANIVTTYPEIHFYRLSNYHRLKL